MGRRIPREGGGYSNFGMRQKSLFPPLFVYAHKDYLMMTHKKKKCSLLALTSHLPSSTREKEIIAIARLCKLQDSFMGSSIDSLIELITWDESVVFMHRRITITSMSNTAVNVIINTREKNFIYWPLWKLSLGRVTGYYYLNPSSFWD